MRFATSLAFCKLGISTANNNAIIEITTNNSTNVNPFFDSLIAFHSREPLSTNYYIIHTIIRTPLINGLKKPKTAVRGEPNRRRIHHKSNIYKLYQLRGHLGGPILGSLHTAHSAASSAISPKFTLQSSFKSAATGSLSIASAQSFGCQAA